MTRVWIAALSLSLSACSSSSGNGDGAAGADAGGMSNAGSAGLSGNGGNPGSLGPSSEQGEPANTFRCGNWADTRDNFVNGNLRLSGMLTTDTYDTVLTKADQILAGFESTVGANAVRLPINEGTVLGDWWNTYKAAIDAAVARSMRVIVAYWAWHNGKADDPAKFNAMWDRVVDTYASNKLVYFEIFNEPWAYSDPYEFMDIEIEWLARHANIPRSRVIIAGSWSDQEVRLQGSNPDLDGTLLSLHIYPFSNEMRNVTQDWKDALEYNFGRQASRTIVTEWGAPMTTGADYSGPGDGDHNASFITGVATYLHDNDVGSCYWPVLRSADTWSLTTLTGTQTDLSLTINNESGFARVQEAFRF